MKLNVEQIKTIVGIIIKRSETNKMVVLDQSIMDLDQDDVIAILTELNKIFVYNGKFDELIGYKKYFKHNITNIQIKDIPFNNVNNTAIIMNLIAEYTSLIQLQINNCNIKDINLLGLGFLKKLESIDLSYNELSSLDLSYLGNIQNLNLSYNKFVDFPLGLENLDSLKNLDLSNNTLTSSTCNLRTYKQNLSMMQSSSLSKNLLNMNLSSNNLNSLSLAGDYKLFNIFNILNISAGNNLATPLNPNEFCFTNFQVLPEQPIIKYFPESLLQIPYMISRIIPKHAAEIIRNIDFQYKDYSRLKITASMKYIESIKFALFNHIFISMNNIISTTPNIHSNFFGKFKVMNTDDGDFREIDVKFISHLPINKKFSFQEHFSKLKKWGKITEKYSWFDVLGYSTKAYMYGFSKKIIDYYTPTIIKLVADTMIAFKYLHDFPFPPVEMLACIVFSGIRSAIKYHLNKDANLLGKLCTVAGTPELERDTIIQIINENKSLIIDTILYYNNVQNINAIFQKDIFNKFECVKLKNLLQQFSVFYYLSKLAGKLEKTDELINEFRDEFNEITEHHKRMVSFFEFSKENNSKLGNIIQKLIDDYVNEQVKNYKAKVDPELLKDISKPIVQNFEEDLSQSRKNEDPNFKLYKKWKKIQDFSGINRYYFRSYLLSTTLKKAFSANFLFVSQNLTSIGENSDGLEQCHKKRKFIP